MATSKNVRLMLDSVVYGTLVIRALAR